MPVALDSEYPSLMLGAYAMHAVLSSFVEARLERNIVDIVRSLLQFQMIEMRFISRTLDAAASKAVWNSMEADQQTEDDTTTFGINKTSLRPVLFPCFPFSHSKTCSPRPCSHSLLLQA